MMRAGQNYAYTCIGIYVNTVFQREICFTYSNTWCEYTVLADPDMVSAVYLAPLL